MKSLILLEQIINDVPLTNLKRQEAFAHLQSIANKNTELEEKVNEMREKVKKFQDELNKLKKDSK